MYTIAMIAPLPPTALITGAAMRVGRALALSLAATGWRVALHCHRSRAEADALRAEIRRGGGEACVLEADLRDTDVLAALLPGLKAQGWMPCCLINNAALFEKDSLATLAPARLQAHMSLNLQAALLLMQGFAALYDGEDGNIVNITDGMTGWSISPQFLSYTLSKQALLEATRLLAPTLAPRIRINAIAPGATLPSDAENARTFEKLRKLLPLQRTSRPEEVCDALHYLLRARSMTGQVLTLSGGSAPLLYAQAPDKT